MTDFTRATEMTIDVGLAVDDAFEYHKWDDLQVAAGGRIRKALADAVKVIIESAPPCPDRTTAIRLCREARMWGNSAITSRGRW